MTLKEKTEGNILLEKESSAATEKVYCFPPLGR